MNLKTAIPILIVAVILIGTVVFARNKTANNKQETPNPQPTPIPTTQNQNPGWKTFIEEAQNISFQYPENLQTKYIRTQEWPPKITVSSESFSCNEGGQIEGKPLTVRNTINGREYCIESTTEGAAGTLYSNYTYTFLKDNKLVKLQFVLAYPQCENYDDPQKTECENENQAFDLDNLVDRIAQSIQFDVKKP